MRTLFLIEEYAIRNDGVWTLISLLRNDEHYKRMVLADAKRKGYEYDRKEKAYILRQDDACDRAIRVTKITD